MTQWLLYNEFATVWLRKQHMFMFSLKGENLPQTGQELNLWNQKQSASHWPPNLTVAAAMWMIMSLLSIQSCITVWIWQEFPTKKCCSWSATKQVQCPHTDSHMEHPSPSGSVMIKLFLVNLSTCFLLWQCRANWLVAQSSGERVNCVIPLWSPPRLWHSCWVYIKDRVLIFLICEIKPKPICEGSTITVRNWNIGHLKLMSLLTVHLALCFNKPLHCDYWVCHQQATGNLAKQLLVILHLNGHR